MTTQQHLEQLRKFVGSKVYVTDLSGLPKGAYVRARLVEIIEKGTSAKVIRLDNDDDAPWEVHINQVRLQLPS